MCLTKCNSKIIVDYYYFINYYNYFKNEIYHYYYCEKCNYYYYNYPRNLLSGAFNMALLIAQLATDFVASSFRIRPAYD